MEAAASPGHRIECRPSSRRITVSIDGATVAETTRAVELHETGLPVRWYIPKDDVSAELRANEEVRTHCPYKGDATHWDVAGERAIAWSYEDAVNDGVPVRGMLSFYNERVDIDVDGHRQERPSTRWSPGR